MPGGFNALQRIYRDIEEPMMEQLNPNPFQALLNNQQSSSGSAPNRQAGTENTQPLPNPWGPRQAPTTAATTPAASAAGATPSTTTTTTTTSSASTTPTSAANMNNLFAQLLGGGGGAARPASATPAASTTTPIAASTGNPTHDIMQQMVQNPRAMETVLNTPYMQSMLDMIANNPQMSRMIVENSPQLGGANPELREQIARSMPTMLQQVNQSLFNR